MIIEDEFDLQELWNVVLKGDAMTIIEQKELQDRLDKLQDSECLVNISADQEIFIHSVIPFLFGHRISIAPIIVEQMGLSMTTKFKYESEPYCY